MKSVRFQSELFSEGFASVPNLVLTNFTMSVAAKALYVSLCMYAGKKEECWPGQDRLADEVGVSKTTLTKASRELADLGLIEVRRPGQGRTNRYVLLDAESKNVGSGFQESSILDSNISGIPMEVRKGKEEKTENICVPEETSSSPTSSPKTTEPTSGAAPEPAGFARFWASYPRKVRKPDAMKAYKKALDRDGVPVIWDGLAAHLARWEAEETPQKFIPHPSTFLNKSDYLEPPTLSDQPFTPEQAEVVRALARGLSDDERARRSQNKEYPYDEETLKRLGG